MRVAIEVTSPLQSIFALSVLRKNFPNDVLINIDFLIFNNHVNDESISSFKKITRYIDHKYRFYDFRHSRSKQIEQHKVMYELIIIRSRLGLNVHERFAFSRKYFSRVGNCENVKIAQSKLSFRRIFTVEDGFSNWNEVSFSYLKMIVSNFSINSLLSGWFAIPLIFRNFLPKNNFIEHYSIFSDNQRFSILHEYKDIVSLMNKSLEKDYDVRHLFIGTWPMFKDRFSPSNKNEQLHYFEDYLDNNANLYNKVIHIKDHPKYKLEIKEGSCYDFVSLPEPYADLPTEVILNCFPNLECIYGFPSTTLYLMSVIMDIDADICVFVKRNDEVYNYKRSHLISGERVYRVEV